MYIVDGATGGGTQFTVIIDILNETWKYIVSGAPVNVDFAQNFLRRQDGLIALRSRDGTSGGAFDYARQNVIALYK